MSSRMASLKEAAVWSFVPNRWYSWEHDSADVVSKQLAAMIKPPEMVNKTTGNHPK